MKKLLLSTSLILSSSLAFADVSVIGLILNKTTVEDLQKLYPSAVCDEQNSIDPHSKDCEISQMTIKLNGVTDSVITTFDDSNTLQFVSIILNKNNFDNIKSMLDSKYTQIKSEIPFVGNKYVAYSKDNSTISLDAPHLSFDMTLTYITDKYYKKMSSTIQEKEKKEQKQQADLL